MSCSTAAASVSASGGNRSRSPAGSSARLLGISSLIAWVQLAAIHGSGQRRSSPLHNGPWPFTLAYAERQIITLRACHAVQLAGVRAGLPAGGAGWVFPHCPAGGPTPGTDLAGRRKPVLLRLVEPEIRYAPRRLHPRQLLVRTTYPA